MLVFSAGMNPNIYRFLNIRVTVKPTADGLSAREMWGERNYGAEALREGHSRDMQRGIIREFQERSDYNALLDRNMKHLEIYSGALLSSLQQDVPRSLSIQLLKPLLTRP
jgi:hypothetical protein